jgi:molybdopterin molybdotransferase
VSLLHLDEARARLLAGIVPLPAQTNSLAQASGRITAEAITARLTQPPFPASAMDGWAVRFADRPGPWRIIGTSAAGHPFPGALQSGEAVRIFTGALVPEGADTVIVQEEMVADEASVRLTGEGPPHAGAHIRKAGQDFAAGQLLIDANTRLTARHLGLLAASGHGSVAVRPRPRVALLATGDELVAPGQTPSPGQIVNAGSVMLASLLTAAGADVSDIGILPDQRAPIAAAVSQAQADIIITIGGASVGDHDLIIPVLKDLGASLDFWKIAMRPGKPLIAGALGTTRILGLPGNPVSAYVCALLFAWPLIRALAGLSASPPLAKAILAAPIGPTGSRRDHLRARRLPDGRLEPAPTQDSAQLAHLAKADALIVREAYAPPAQSGETVDAIMLDMFSDVA